MKFKHLIDNITIDLWFSWNFSCMEDIIRTCNPIIRFSKFTSNKKIEEEFEGFLSKIVWRETLKVSNMDTYILDTSVQAKIEYTCFLAVRF